MEKNIKFPLVERNIKFPLMENYKKILPVEKLKIFFRWKKKIISSNGGKL